MEEEQVVVLGVLHVGFFFTSRGRCALCCEFYASCASYVSCVCASTLPLEEGRDIFRFLQTLPPATKGEAAEQGPKEATGCVVALAEVSTRGDGGPAREEVRVVVSLPFAHHARMVLLRLWNLPRLVLRVLLVLRVISVLILALLWRTAPRFPCSVDSQIPVRVKEEPPNSL